MKDLNNIEDWYRNELDKFDVSPDADSWQSLSEKLDANTPLTDETISEWYKKEVNKLEERPDFTVWEKLATKLDTASVWDKLVVSLNQYDKFIWWRNLTVKGTAILLLLFGTYLTYNNYTTVKDKSTAGNSNNNSTLATSTNSLNNTNKKVEAQQNEFVSNTPLTNQKNKEVLLVDKNNALKQQVNQAVTIAKNNIAKKQNDNITEALYASINNNISKYQSVNAKNSIAELTSSEEKILFTEINRHELAERDITHLYEKGSYLVKKEKNKIVFNNKRFSTYSMYGIYTRRFYVGLNAGFKKQGLITSIKKNSELANYNKSDYFDYGNNFGATVGYILNDNINLESNLNFNSTAGYKRNYSLEGISFNEKLNLSYTTINLLAKKMNTKSTFDNKVYSTNLIGGIYASYLRSSSSDINGATIKSNDYNNTDFGIVLGIEQDRYLSKKLVITPGIRYNQGIANIANENSDFKSAQNFSLEFNIGIKYIFLKTSK